MKPRLLFSGYYGLGNAGDEAVLAGLLQGMREVGLDAEVTVLSANPALTEQWHGVRAVPRMRPALLQAISECDTLVSGGGSLLQDVTSTASLAYYLTVIALAKGMGRRVVVAAQGMGPLLRPASRRWTGSVVGRADLVTVRDEESAGLLRECGVRQPIHVTADPAFLLSSSSQVPRSTFPDALRVGLALRAWKDRDAVAWGVDLCREMAKRGAAAVLIPMHEPHDRELAESVRSGAGEEVEISPPPKDLTTVLDALYGCEVLLGMRLHALLLAANAGRPVVAWSYDPKVDALMHRVGSPEGLLPLDATPDQAAEAVLQAAQRPPDASRIELLRRDARRTLELMADRLTRR